MDEKDCRRQDLRYVETSSDLSDWVQVRAARQFGAQSELNGVLWDLSPRAIKIAFPAENLKGAENALLVGTQMLITFTFRNLTTVTAKATVARQDTLANGVGAVLFFDIIRNDEREAIEQICRAYADQSGKHSEPMALPSEKR